MTGVTRKVLRRLPAGLKTGLKKAVHPAQRSSLQRVLGAKTSDLGLLSVIIPIFNVEDFLADCLNSVISQSYPFLEILLADDGSTDGSLAIARDYARRDKRIRVMELEHGGNGRARNLAVAVARGQYLTFADSDDVVADHAYSSMMKQIAGSGSDFVVGSSDRLIGRKHVPTKLSSRLHEYKRVAITISDFPEILDDVFLWNKLFVRAFWDAKVAPIPEGILYEDQEATAKAFIRAERFDVLEDVVYSWRQRPGSSSITQGKGELNNLSDRLAVAGSVSKLILAEANDEALQVWCKRLFGSDLVPYFDLVANRDDDYWECLSVGAAKLFQLFSKNASIRESTWHSMDPHARVFLMLAVEGLRQAVEDVIVDRIDSGTGFEVFHEGGHFVARPNYWDELEQTKGTPALPCTSESLTFESEIRLRDLQDGRGPMLRGHAYIRGFTSSFETGSILVSIRAADGSEYHVPVTRIEDLRLDVEANDAFASHVSSGFELDLQVPPDLVDAISAKVELTIGGASWSAVHSLKIAKTLVDLQTSVDGRHPAVVNFAVDDATETFIIDVDWGRAPASEQVYLSTSQVRIDPSSTVQLDAGLRRYNFELHHLHWGRQVYSYPSGAYTVRHKVSEDSKALSFQASMRLNIQSPLDHMLRHSNLTAWVTQTNIFAVSIGAPLTMVERSKFGQRQLQKTFNESIPRDDHVLIESFGGASCSDSPRALAESLDGIEPNAIIYCSVKDNSVPVPDFVIPLIQGTTSWFKNVRTARLLINNNIFPFFFKKGPEQTYLQTWHGTPIKKIGIDAPRTYISASYRLGVIKEAVCWTGLLAQNTYSAEIFQRCFNYRGPILQFGYPRNDLLVQADNIRADLRASLSIAKAQVVVLVAPTWRDDLYRSGNAKGHGELDLKFLMESSPENYTFLIRAHQNEAGMRTIATHRKALDVSGYPSINELIIASDCLITDYSSLAFDYLNTGKPILAYLAQGSNYERVRGTYIGASELFGTQAAHTMPALVDLLHRVESNEAALQNLHQIKDDYVPLDDGDAGSRILQELYYLTKDGL